MTTIQKALRGCDFCSAETPAAFVYPCGNFMTAHVQGDELARDRDGKRLPLDHLIGAWMACRDCSLLIEGDQWEPLLERVMAETGAPEEAVRAIVPTLWAGFRSHRSGPRRPVEELDDCRHPATHAVRTPARSDLMPGIYCVSCGDVVGRVQ